MRENCYFIEKDNIIDDIILLPKEETLHMSKVLRQRVGERVKCFYDGSDYFDCEILSIDKSSSKLKILGKSKCLANPQKHITLFQGLPKLDKLELITQKLTELGISEITPFNSKFCIAKDNPNKMQRLNKIAISACKQSGRTQVLKINNTINLSNIDFSKYDLVLFANEKEKLTKINQFSSQISKAKSIAYIVGSEGGFSDDEIEFLSGKSNSFSLGDRILRTETASISIGAYISFVGEN